jgi:pimeloyl-[acyl-carrier protein] synthase
MNNAMHASETEAMNLFTPDFLADPYPIYAALRASAPVAWCAPIQHWLVTGSDAVHEVLHDAERFSSSRAASFIPADERLSFSPFLERFARWMLFQDPPQHTRIRSLVTKTFTPRSVEELRPHIQANIDYLLKPLAAAGRCDLIRDVAFPLPAMVICEMLGAPAEDRDELHRFTSDIAAVVSLATDKAARARAQESMEAISEYFLRLIAKRRAAPAQDLLSRLIHAEEEGQILDDEELCAQCVLLIAAGHETTQNLIGNGMLALLRNPAQLAKLRANPAMLKNAVEELLRYDSPVQAVNRVAACDTIIGGQAIREGDALLALVGATNRDPDRFPEPDQLDITRADTHHMSFGVGSHFCVGAPLARVEAQMVFASLLAQFPTIQLESDKVSWNSSNLALRGLLSLPLVLSA